MPSKFRIRRKRNARAVRKTFRSRRRPIGNRPRYGGRKAKLTYTPSDVIPLVTYKKLPWTATGQLTKEPGVAGVNFTESHFFRTNCIWDPSYQTTVDATYRNTSATGVDYLKLMYRKYRVYGCKVEFKANNISGDAIAENVIIAFSHGNDTAMRKAEFFGPNVHISSILSRPFTRRMHLTGKGSSGDTKSIKFYIDCRKDLGLTKEQYTTEDLTASMIDNYPLWQTALAITIGDVHEFSTQRSRSVAIQFCLKLTYYVKLFDRREIHDQTNNMDEGEEPDMDLNDGEYKDPLIGETDDTGAINGPRLGHQPDPVETEPSKVQPLTGLALKDSPEVKVVSKVPVAPKSSAFLRAPLK